MVISETEMMMEATHLEASNYIISIANAAPVFKTKKNATSWIHKQVCRILSWGVKLNEIEELHKCYIVATCDRDLKRRIRKIPGVPIMYVLGHKFSIERMPDAYGAPQH